MQKNTEQNKRGHISSSTRASDILNFPSLNVFAWDLFWSLFDIQWYSSYSRPGCSISQGCGWSFPRLVWGAPLCPAPAARWETLTSRTQPLGKKTRQTWIWKQYWHWLIDFRIKLEHITCTLSSEVCVCKITQNKIISHNYYWAYYYVRCTVLCLFYLKWTAVVVWAVQICW